MTGAVRINVFATRQLTTGKGKRQRTKVVGVGWQGWNPDPREEAKHARLTGSGSFYWPGAIAAYVAVKRMIREDATIEQITIETISGVAIGRIYV